MIKTKVVIGWFELQLWIWLVDLNYKNNLASELVENRSFFKPIKIEEIVIFIIKRYNNPRGKLGEHDKSL